MLGQITKSFNRPPPLPKPKKIPQTDDDHHNNRGDFDHRKPEFDFTIQAHRSQIRQRDQSGTAISAGIHCAISGNQN